MLPPLLRHLPAAVLLLAAPTPPPFTPVQPELLGRGGAFTNAVADVDGDGDLDLFVGFNGAPNRLYRNDGGVLIETAGPHGLDDVRPTRAAAWGDADGDGDADLLLGFAPGVGSVLALYRNDGGRFTDVTADAGLVVPTGGVRQPAWIDVDGDDDLDLFVAFRDAPNRLYRNDGGRFHDIAAAVGLADPRRSVGASWGDLDGDGDLDVVVANQDGDANGVFVQEAGRFRDVAESLGVAWGGRTPRLATHGSVRPCIEDVDGDGRLDLFFANYGPNGLFLRRASGFVDVSAGWGVAADGRHDACAFADVDADGRLDLYVNGTVTGGRNYPDRLYLADGTRLHEVTPPALSALAADHGVQWFDLDRDGALDLALTGADPTGMHLVLRNGLAPPRAAATLAVRVRDGRGRATRAGAEVRAYRAGTRRLLALRVVDGGSGYNAQSDQPVHLGLGSTDRVDIEVTWPAGGRRLRTLVRGVAPATYRGRWLDVRSASPQPGGR